jgi:hypothetical protein
LALLILPPVVCGLPSSNPQLMPVSLQDIGNSPHWCFPFSPSYPLVVSRRVAYPPTPAWRPSRFIRTPTRCGATTWAADLAVSSRAVPSISLVVGWQAIDGGLCVADGCGKPAVVRFAFVTETETEMGLWCCDIYGLVFSSFEGGSRIGDKDITCF